MALANFWPAMISAALASVALAGCVTGGGLVGAVDRDMPAPLAFALDAPLPAEAEPAATTPTILALSGGGPDGAFGAGYLVGRDALGRGLSADIVTGVSIGALIALFAFAGDEAALMQLFTGPRLRELAEDRNVLGLAFGKTMSKGRALEELIDDSLTPHLLARIAVEHRRGRRLLVATTNLETMAGVGWDLGALAASGAPASRALMRKILLASASIPGAFPPVLLPSATAPASLARHVDGGASAQFFVPRLRERRASAITVIVNNRIDGDPPEPRMSGLAAAQRGFSTLVRAHTRSQIETVRLRAERVGARLTVVTLPQDWSAAGALDFDPAQIRRTFERGLTAAAGS